MADFFLKPGTELRSPNCNYKVIKVLGHGGFGITYLVEVVVRVGYIPITARLVLKEHFINSLCSRDPQSQRVVVSSAAGQQEVDRSMRAFISEAQRLQKLGISHSNIVKVNEVFEANNTAYFVMEYLDGGSLADYVQGRGRLSFAEMSALMEPVCNSVAMLHRNSMAHYDIKPQNIMLVNKDGQLHPVLIDFGLAKHYDGQGNATSSIAAAGYTPGYAPVEQYAGFSTFKPAADIYALGATILFCLTGHNPAPAQKLNLDDVSNDLTALNLSAKVVNALLSALEFRSKDRLADAGTFAAAIFAGNFSATPVKMPPQEPQPSQTQPAPEPVLTAEQMYQKGKAYYDKKQYSKAVLWFREAAEQDYAAAQCCLGGCFFSGEGVMHDYTQAVAWYRKAAEQGYAKAQNWLGYCYHYGYGVTQDYTQAAAWWRKSAEQGYAGARYWLGYCYDNGYGVTQDISEALYWYRKAAAQDHSTAKDRLQELESQGYHDLTAAQMYQKGKAYYDKKQYSEAVPWFREAAEQGHAEAQYNLGECYYNGRGVTKGWIQAVAWYRKAAEQGYADAQSRLGNCYFIGWGVTKDYTQSAAWYRKVAEQGNAEAQSRLGWCYQHGEGVAKDYVQAIAWWRKAAERGYASAQYSLGRCYYNGEGVTKDRTQAAAWWRKAAEQGDEYAQYRLGECYYNGEGVTQNKSEALYWYRKAAEQGDSGAKYRVQRLESEGVR